MSSHRTVIIGSGQGGFQLAASLRQEGYDGTVTLIGDEPGLPYQRPPLSKAYLKEGRLDRLMLRPESFFERAAIEIAAPERATRIDRASRRVETASGRSFDYDHLVLATGTRNFRPPISGIDLDGIFGLRTSADADRLRDALVATRHVIVIGGGFIGLEFAAVAVAAGHAVTLIEAGPRLMGRAVSPSMSESYLRYHQAEGVNVLLGAPVAEILPDNSGQAIGVRLADGRSILGDLVLLAAGVRPNTELAEAAELACQNGIVVDSLLQTADPAISALGDCAAFPDPLGAGPIRLESVQAATDHARAIARRLTGKPAPYDAVPWFWSDQGERKLQIAGLGIGADEDHEPPEHNGKKLVFRFKMGKLLSVETINAAAEHMAARQLLRRPDGVTRRELADRDYDIGALAKELKERA